MKYIEVRWHGRAQQGVVTAAKLLAEAALGEGKYVQAFPEFGPERMGAPIRAFNRVSTEPIRLHSQVANPSIVLIVDPTLMGMALSGGMDAAGSVVSGTGDDAVFIVNTADTPKEVRKKLGLKNSTARVFTLDASKISMETLKRHMPNTPMLGAFSKATGVVEVSSLIDNFKENYSKKFSQDVIDANVEAIKRGFEEARGE